MYADLHTNVLSGLLFNPESGDSSGTREADRTVTSGSEMSVNHKEIELRRKKGRQTRGEDIL